MVFADEVQQKLETSCASATTPSSAGTRITLPRISDIVNTSVRTKQTSPDLSTLSSPPKPLIASKEELEHDRSLDEKRVEKLLTAFDTEEEIAERAKEKEAAAKQAEISTATKNTESETSQASAKPAFSFGKISLQNSKFFELILLHMGLFFLALKRLFYYIH